MYALADFYSFIFSGVPSICVSHIYRTLNKRKSPCDMIATNEHIAACSSHWIVINNNERPIIATCSSQWIVIDNLWIWPMNICVIWRLIKLLWSMTQLNVHATQRRLMVVIYVLSTFILLGWWWIRVHCIQNLHKRRQIHNWGSFWICSVIYLWYLFYFNWHLFEIKIFWSQFSVSSTGFPPGIRVITKLWVGKCVYVTEVIILNFHLTICKVACCEN